METKPRVKFTCMYDGPPITHDLIGQVHDAYLQLSPILKQMEKGKALDREFVIA